MRRSALSLFVAATISLGGVRPGSAKVLIVATTADTGVVSLRSMLSWAESPGPDSIRFAIPLSDPGYDASHGTWTIRPRTPLPMIMDGWLVIDGTSQARFIGGDPNPSGPEIVVDGEDISIAPGFNVQAPQVIVQGLTINNCRLSAIAFLGANGGKVLGCYLGTTSDGLAAARNEYGVWIHSNSRDIVVGLPGNSQDGNLISGNQCGVLVVDSCKRISIAGNRIGVNRPGTDTLSNLTAAISIQSGCDSAEISENLIGGRETGIYIEDSRHVYIGKNSIGTDTAWNRNLGIFDQGILFDYYARNNIVAWNSIGNCDRAGILVLGSGCIFNTLTMNMVSKITGKGIENAYGGNNDLPPPTVLSVNSSTVTGTAGPESIVEIFADDSSQGRDVCGRTTADASGAFAFPLTKPIVRKYVTATATDSLGNTSEFSVPYIITGVERNCVSGMPITFGLEQNFPNPFNPNTTIAYELPEALYVRLSVCDMLGREVSALVDERRDAGIHKVTFNASGLSTGVYFYRIHAGTFTEAKRLLVLK